MKPLAAPKRTRGRPLQNRRRPTHVRRKWTWRSLLQPPLPQLAALVIVLGSLYAFATSPVFAVATVQVVGQDNLPELALKQACDCTGRNIFLLPLDAIRQRLTRVAWVDVSNVYARLPDRIVIDARYRTPVALWRTTTTTYTVDGNGMILYDTMAPPVATNLIPTTATVPIIYSAHDAALAPGQHVPIEALQMVFAVQSRLQATLATSIDRFRWSPVSGLVAHSRLGWWVLLGMHFGEDLRVRLATLESMYHAHTMQNNHCNYIDLEPLPYPYCNYQLQWRGAWGPGS
jgi:hypothetical protein